MRGREGVRNIYIYIERESERVRDRDVDIEREGERGERKGEEGGMKQNSTNTGCIQYVLTCSKLTIIKYNHPDNYSCTTNKSHNHHDQ